MSKAPYRKVYGKADSRFKVTKGYTCGACHYESVDQPATPTTEEDNDRDPDA